MLAASTGLGLVSSVRILYEVECPVSSFRFAFKTLMSSGISGLGSRQSTRSHKEPCDSGSRDFQGSPWYMLGCAGVVTTSVTWLSQVGSPSCLYPSRQGQQQPISHGRGQAWSSRGRANPRCYPPLWVELLPGTAAELEMAVRSPELSSHLIGDD